MPKEYAAVPLFPLQSGASYFRPHQDLPDVVTTDSPASFVMTDLRHVTAITIAPTASIEDALKTMIREGVRLLLVIDVNRAVCGLITATDIQGEKPMKVLEAQGGLHDEILVGSIMTPAERLEVLYMEDVRKARVGNIVATLKRAGRQHALVVDVDTPSGRETVRGIFSTTQISRQLGVPIETIGVAHTFAELEQALNSHSKELAGTTAVI